MDWRQYIEQRPDVLVGKPVIRGTRISVELILERLGSGWTHDQVLESYPHLKPEHILAALQYAASALSTDEFILLADQKT